MVHQWRLLVRFGSTTGNHRAGPSRRTPPRTQQPRTSTFPVAAVFPTTCDAHFPALVRPIAHAASVVGFATAARTPPPSQQQPRIKMRVARSLEPVPPGVCGEPVHTTLGQRLLAELGRALPPSTVRVPRCARARQPRVLRARMSIVLRPSPPPPIPPYELRLRRGVRHPDLDVFVDVIVGVVVCHVRAAAQALSDAYVGRFAPLLPEWEQRHNVCP